MIPDRRGKGRGEVAGTTESTKKGGGGGDGEKEAENRNVDIASGMYNVRLPLPLCCITQSSSPCVETSFVLP